MSSKSEKEEPKASKKSQKAVAKAKRAEQRKTAQVSRERLNRITRTKRHHLRTTNRVFKYGTKSFVRNTWLSLAAIAIMTITLIVVGITVIATSVMDTTIKELESKVEVSIYIRQTATGTEVNAIADKIRALDSVADVKTVSPNEATDETIEMIAGNKGLEDESLVENLKEIPVILPWTINVTMTKLSQIEELKNLVENDSSIKNVLDAKAPSYDSGDSETIKSISDTANNVRIVGFAAAGVFGLIAILVVFNTIRMAIFNRKEEIYMMRLVGASTSFIVGPFLVEASLYGVVAAVIACALLYLGTYLISTSNSFAELVLPTFDIMTSYWYLVLICLLFLGMLIGVVSALLAARKYLKVK